jgi:tRNA-dihydrouridine synthase
MMPQPELVKDTFALLSRHLCLPVSGKIRLGWDDAQRNYAEIAKIMEDNGASLVAMHARTKIQKYGGQADWEEIARLRDVVDLPVIGNGDVRTPEDIDRLKRKSGCEAVMIGRAAIGNPWIFNRQKKRSLLLGEIIGVVEFHLREMVAYYGENLGVILFRKHLKQYLTGIPGTAEMLNSMLQAQKQKELEKLLGEIKSPAN